MKTSYFIVCSCIVVFSRSLFYRSRLPNIQATSDNGKMFGLIYICIYSIELTLQVKVISRPTLFHTNVMLRQNWKETIFLCVYLSSVRTWIRGSTGLVCFLFCICHLYLFFCIFLLKNPSPPQWVMYCGIKISQHIFPLNLIGFLSVGNLGIPHSRLMSTPLWWNYTRKSGKHSWDLHQQIQRNWLQMIFFVRGDRKKIKHGNE